MTLNYYFYRIGDPSLYLMWTIKLHQRPLQCVCSQNSCIYKDQTGFIKGRYIGENTRLINDIREQTQVDNTPGILISVDFRKAFDSLE